MSARLATIEEQTTALSCADAQPLATLDARIEALREAGAAAWDPPAFGLLTSLHERASRGRGRETRVLAWAAERCDALEQWMAETRDAIDAMQLDADAVARDLPAALVLAALATCRPPAPPDERGGFLRSQARLETSLVEVRTAVVSAQAHAAAAVPSGPYNPTALAGKLLARLDELAPGYLRACVAALDDLAVLQQLEREASAPKSQQPRARRSSPPRSSRTPRE
ncbi:MAG: DUF2894 domain-containing protein [Polyangiales bacterium]